MYNINIVINIVPKEETWEEQKLRHEKELNQIRFNREILLGKKYGVLYHD